MPRSEPTIDLLRRFDPGTDARATRSLDRTLHLLRASPAPFDRRTFSPGHLTASGIVLSPDRSLVLLVYHPRLERWLQPGGHVEPTDASLVETARREILEETGITTDTAFAPLVVGVDVHEIPARPGEPAHLHHDVALRFVAERLEPPVSEEGSQAVWCPPGDLDRYDVDGALRRSVARALR